MSGRLLRAELEVRSRSWTEMANEDNIIGYEEPDIAGLQVWTDHFSSITPIERD